MTETKELSVSEMLAARAVKKKSTEHWSHQRFMTLAFIALGVLTGWFIWLVGVSWWLREKYRVQYGVNAADAANFIVLLIAMTALAALGWYAIRRISNNHIGTPKEASS